MENFENKSHEAPSGDGNTTNEWNEFRTSSGADDSDEWNNLGNSSNSSEGSSEWDELGCSGDDNGAGGVLAGESSGGESPGIKYERGRGNTAGSGGPSELSGQTSGQTSGQRIISFMRNLGKTALRILANDKYEKPKNEKVYLLSERMKDPDGLRGRELKKYKEFWNKIYEYWDNIGIELPMELGEMVENYINEKDENGEPKWRVGFHHSWAINGEHYETDGTLRQIMEEGLCNMGDISSGVVNFKDPPVSKTVSMCPNMFYATMQMKGSYKGSTGALLIVVPSAYVSEGGALKPGMENEIYNHGEHGVSYIKPEYVKGFIKNLGVGSTLEYTSREELLDGYAKQDQEEE